MTVLFFASYRERAGGPRRELELPAGARVSDLLRRLREEGLDLPESASVAVNRRYAAGDRELEEGDEVALIPPVAGG